MKQIETVVATLVGTLIVAFVVVAVLGTTARADTDCKCLAVAGDVSAAIQAEVAKADSLYVRGDYAAALAIYVKAHATAPKDSALLYAQAMAKWQLGARADAKALFERYLAAAGTLAYRDRAEAGLSDISAGVSATVGGAVGATGKVGGAVGGMVNTGVDTGMGVTGRVTAKPKKLGKGAAMVLGVVAIAAVGAVGIHMIAAGMKDDVELDAKFDLGLGATGVVVGVTAFYVGGITAAAGTAGSVKCASLPAGRPVVAPLVTNGGGGIAAAMSF